MENSDSRIDPESYHTKKLDSSNETAEGYGEFSVASKSSDSRIYKIIVYELVFTFF